MAVTDKGRFERGRGRQVERLTHAFQHYRRALAKVIARIVKPQDIEDIVQETYIRIFQAAQKERIFHPRSFFLKTARNLALNHIARADALNHICEATASQESDLEAPLEEAELSHARQSESPEERLQAEQDFLLFCRSVRDLPLQCRRAFILRKVYGMSQRDVARALGITESTVEKHIAKGLVTTSAYMQLHGYAPSHGVRAQPRPAGGERNGA